MADLLRFEEVEAFFDSRSFVEKTAAQINKDLSGLTDMSIQLDDLDQQKDVLGFFLGHIETALIDLIKLNQLQQFIYRVDLPEKDFLKQLSAGDLTELAYLVLRREAKKVYLKERFTKR